MPKVQEGNIRRYPGIVGRSRSSGSEEKTEYWPGVDMASDTPGRSEPATSTRISSTSNDDIFAFEPQESSRKVKTGSDASVAIAPLSNGKKTGAEDDDIDMVPGETEVRSEANGAVPVNTSAPRASVVARRRKKRSLDTKTRGNQNYTKTLPDVASTETVQDHNSADIEIGNNENSPKNKTATQPQPHTTTERCQSSTNPIPDGELEMVSTHYDNRVALAPSTAPANSSHHTYENAATETTGSQGGRNGESNGQPSVVDPHNENTQRTRNKSSSSTPNTAITNGNSDRHNESIQMTPNDLVNSIYDGLPACDKVVDSLRKLLPLLPSLISDTARADPRSIGVPEIQNASPQYEKNAVSIHGFEARNRERKRSVQLETKLQEALEKISFLESRDLENQATIKRLRTERNVSRQEQKKMVAQAKAKDEKFIKQEAILRRSRDELADKRQRLEEDQFRLRQDQMELDQGWERLKRAEADYKDQRRKRSRADQGANTKDKFPRRRSSSSDRPSKLDSLASMRS